MKEKLVQKEKLIEDTGFIAAQKATVIPDKLIEAKEDFEDTWQAIEHQVHCAYNKCVCSLVHHLIRSLREYKRLEMLVIGLKNVVHLCIH